jgi:hypothetical protein
MGREFSCNCPERKKPVGDRNWVVTLYKMKRKPNAFGNLGIDSKYSEVFCMNCFKSGRTKAKFVEKLWFIANVEDEAFFKVSFFDFLAENIELDLNDYQIGLFYPHEITLLKQIRAENGAED